jgi:hypothetical protein
MSPKAEKLWISFLVLFTVVGIVVANYHDRKAREAARAHKVFDEQCRKVLKELP